MKAALQGLKGRAPSAGFVFASAKHSLALALDVARELTGTHEILGATTAGEITERGLLHGGIAVWLMASDDLRRTMVLADQVKSAPGRAAERLASGIPAGSAANATILLVDGLAGTGEAIIESMRQRLGPMHDLVGGAAGDDGAFTGTLVGAPGTCATDMAVGLHLSGPRPLGIGVDCGLVPTTEVMRVSRAVDNVVHELDGRPAFDIYRELAKKKGVELDPAKAGEFLINNELGIMVFDTMKKARAPLGVGADGSLTLAAAIPTGARVCVLGGSPDQLVTAAKNAALEAQRMLNGPAAGILLFDCICRGTLLAGSFQREIDAVRSVFPSVPIGGFLTYGEIARYRGRLDGWHNTTAVVVAIPA